MFTRPTSANTGSTSPPALRLGRPIMWLVSTAAALTLIPRAALGAPDYWDPRLNQVCGLYLDDCAARVPAGQGYWRLTRADFQNEQESGGTHHIFYKCLDLQGKEIENQQVWTSWSYTNETSAVSQFTKGPLDQYWGNFPMYVGTCAGTALCGPTSPGPWPYNAYVDTMSSPLGYRGLSDKVFGMGMTNPQGTPCGAHVSFRLTWRWTINTPVAPILSVAPDSLSPSASEGRIPPPDSFWISNAGGGTLQYTVSDNADWLSTSATSGEVTHDEIDHVDVAYHSEGLPVGIHHAVILITSLGEDGSRSVHVTLTVVPPAYRGDFDGDHDVDQEDFARLQVCMTAPGQPAAPECDLARMDPDIDVDADDVVAFAMCLSGPGQLPPPTCLK